MSFLQLKGVEKSIPSKAGATWVLRQIVDRIAAVEKLARAAIDEADARAVEIDTLQSAMDLDLA